MSGPVLLGSGLLFETIRLENGHYFLLEQHMRRMLNSSDFFGLGLQAEQLRHALNQFAESSKRALERVRVTASSDGEIRVEGFPFPEQLAGIQPVVLSPVAIDSSNPFLYHKTTNRELYTALKAQFPEAFDVLLWNEAGQLTETTIGNLVIEMDGRCYTPPVDCGLLPGTFRAYLLEQGKAEERVLTRAELAAASKVWMINSLRGWVEIRIDEFRNIEG